MACVATAVAMDGPQHAAGAGAGAVPLGCGESNSTILTLRRALGLPDAVVAKGLELERRLARKQGTRLLDAAGCVACLQLAGDQCGTPLSKHVVAALRQTAGTGSAAGPKHRRRLLSFKSLLGLGQETLNELAVKFGCLDADLLAHDIYHQYLASLPPVRRQAVRQQSSVYQCACLLVAGRRLKKKRGRCSIVAMAEYCSVKQSFFKNVIKQVDAVRTRRPKAKGAGGPVVSASAKKRRAAEAFAEFGSREEGGPGQQRHPKPTKQSRQQSYEDWRAKILRGTQPADA